MSDQLAQIGQPLGQAAAEAPLHRPVVEVAGDPVDLEQRRSGLDIEMGGVFRVAATALSFSVVRPTVTP